MSTAFAVPDLGDGATEGRLVALEVAAGETVAEGTLLAEVETDKSIVEVTAPETMAIEACDAAEGEDVEVGETLFTYEAADPDDPSESGDGEGGEPAEPPEPTEDGPSEPDDDSADAVGGASQLTGGASERTVRPVGEGTPADVPSPGSVEGVPEQTDVLIIGAGPGGYVAAIRAGQLGLDVTLVEDDAVGGTCLNYGCIPSKALIHGADIAYEAANAEHLGVSADPTVDIDQLTGWKDDVVDQLTGGVEQLCHAQGVTVVDGVAEFVNNRRATITTDDGETAIDFGNAIVATGSRPIEIPDFPFDSEYVLDSRDALALDERPDSLVVIGAGYIGMELSTVFEKLGTDVTVVEMFDDVLSGYDDDISRLVRERAAEFGIDFRFGEMAASWEETDDGIVVHTEDEDGDRHSLEAEKVFVVGGREPVTDTANLQAAGIELDDDGFVKTDAQGRTTCERIFAIGDVVGEPMLAHKASREGEVAAEAIAGEPSVLDYQAMPAVVFTDPEVATVGMSENDARDDGYYPVVGRMPLASNGRALTLGDTEGFVRIVADRRTELILGAQIVGPNASELIAEVALAIEMDARLSDIAETVHTHPTLSEAVMEAAANARGEAIHTAD
ncbi:dihydrolipoamide dehydrogenase [Halorhabdus utahensis DSM 12940]|uniref:Dihydrolipoyl dehydrogenase n=1 Tax=Halorhabdus utahensis (strain DSM 12940 / JCM 11049 / AX-2) TaxID=519442 RepID=C7NRP0_HALUD|nr:dihydrolipoamide dehydrogenase [Halorhabdus utahensis DSM 12940]